MSTSVPAETGHDAIDVIPIIERQKVGRFWITLFVVSWLITFLDGFDFQVLSFAGSALKKSFHLSNTQFGTLGTIGLAGTLVGGLALGYLGDRIGRRKSIIVATLGFGVFVLAFALAKDYSQLLALRFVSGLFLGGALPLAWALNTEFAPARFRSSSVTTIMVGYSLGSALGGPVSNLLIPKHGWQSVFIAGGLCSLAVTVPVALLLPESVKFLAQKDPTGAAHRRIAAIMRRVAPDEQFAAGARFTAGPVHTGWFTPAQLFTGRLARITPLLWVAYMCSSAIVFFLAFWGPILNQKFGFGTAAAANLSAAAAVAGCVGMVVLGRFIDNRGAGTISVMPVVSVLCLLIIALVAIGPGGYVVMILLANLFIVGGHGGMHGIAGIFYRPAVRANGAAWATSIAKVGAMLGPWLAGVIMDAGVSARGTFFVFALFPLLMSGLLVGLGRAQRRLPADLDGALARPAAAEVVELPAAKTG